MDQFKIWKGVHQGCMLLPCLLNFYAEYITRNAGPDELKLQNQECLEKYQ